MKKNEKWVILLFAIVVVLLYVLSSTDLILKEDYKIPGHIVVITDDTGNPNGDNYKKGMEYAAGIFNLDVTYIPLWEGAKNEDQLEYIRREEKKAALFIIAPIDANALRLELKEENMNTPVFSMNQKLDSKSLVSFLHADDSSLTKEMKDAVILDLKGQKENIYLVSKDAFNKRNKTRENMLKCLFQEEGLSCESLSWKDEKNLFGQIKKPGIFIGMDGESLETLGTLNESEFSGSKKIYGFGWNETIAAFLERRTIKAVLVENEYNKGYLSMVMAAMFLSKQTIDSEVVIEHYFVRPDAMYDPKYEKMLFPISSVIR